MKDMIICIPTKYREEIKGFRTNTLDLGLQDVPGVEIILFCRGNEKMALVDAIREGGYSNIDVKAHWLRSISEIRHYMRYYCMDKYPTRIHWQLDDDVKFFRKLVDSLVTKDIRDADIIIDYMRELAKKAAAENIQCFAPHSTFRHITIEKSRYGHYSYKAQCRGIMGFLPGAPNTFDPDPKIMNLEETVMILGLEDTCEGTDLKAFLRDNFMAVVTEEDTPLLNDENRVYAVKKAVKNFGGSRVKFRHRKLKPLVDAIMEGAI